MSVIAWDGKTVAADRQGTSNQVIGTCQKIFKVKGFAVGFVGQEDVGLMLIQWFKDGAKMDEWLADMQQGESGSALVVVGRSNVWQIGEFPIFSVIEDTFWAWGVGWEIALGAMSFGANAREAVETTNRLHAYCGGGVDVFECAKLTTKIPKVS